MTAGSRYGPAMSPMSEKLVRPANNWAGANSDVGIPYHMECLNYYRA